LNAQDKVKKEEMPQSVVKAIERDFRCTEEIKWYTYEKTANIDQYVVRSSGPNMRCEAVYDKTGRLISSKTVMTNVKLPAEVHNAVMDEYPGWTIAGDQAIIHDFSDRSTYYQVNLKKEGQSKDVYYNKKGKKVTPRGSLEARTVEVAKDDLPQTVVNTIETDFFRCKDNITWRLNDKKSTVDHYVATAQGKNVTCEAIYDKNGRLISSKTIVVDVKLPRPVLQTLVTDYPGWKITGDKAFIRNFDSSTQYFEIYLEKEGETQTVYYNALGEKVNPQVS
jgi:hypothetical protein